MSQDLEAFEIRTNRRLAALEARDQPPSSPAPMPQQAAGIDLTALYSQIAELQERVAQIEHLSKPLEEIERRELTGGA